MLLVLLLVGGIIYILYRFLFSGQYSKSPITLVSSQVAGNSSPMIDQANLPIPYEGGDYSVSFWMYISSFNVNRNKRKHILELGGKSFSTLLVGLGAYKNTLMVRTHSKDPGNKTEGFQTDPPNASTTMTAPPTAADMSRGDSTLSSANVNAIFASHPADDSLLETPVVCDAPDVDLQRWVHVAVVMSGRMIDIYIDGKLARSCVTKSYYKVDPTGVTLKVVDRGGFDGYLSNLSAANFTLNPAQIYNIYSNGPSGASPTLISSLFGFLKGGLT